MSPAWSGPRSPATSSTRARRASASPCSTGTSGTITRAELSAGVQELDFERDGACRQHAAAATELGLLHAFADGLPQGDPGVRIADCGELAPILAAAGTIGKLAARRLGETARPVRIILFDKTSDRNWSLGWHQDRTIWVRERVEAPGFTHWTVKRGLQHVEPPFALLERMVTLRVHLDDVGADNAPLLVAPGSHRLGRVPEASIDETVRRCGTVACTASAGDVWVYATSILHASDRARRAGRRRVLQIDYSADELPDGLEWAGV